jgi:hypothetical protein
MIPVLRVALYIARKDTWRLLRVREVMVWTFAMPIVFFYFLGLVNTVGASADRPDRLGVWIAPDSGFLADELVGRLSARGYRVVRPGSHDEFLALDRRLEIPAGFTASVLAGTPVTLRFSRRGEGSPADYDQVRLRRATYEVLADLVTLRVNSTDPTVERFRELAAEPRMLQLDVKTAGHRVTAPSRYDQSVPGTMVMFTLTVLFTAGAVSLVYERNNGLLRRLAYAPISRGALVLGKWGARMGIGAIQIATALVCGRVIFGVHWGPNLPMVMAVMLSYGSLVATLAMLLGNYGRSMAQVIGFGVTIANLMAGLGGCWWPIEITPMWAQKLALFLPTGWTMDALHKLVNFGAPASSAIPHICVSLALALIAGWFLSRKFRFQ